MRVASLFYLGTSSFAFWLDSLAGLLLRLLHSLLLGFLRGNLWLWLLGLGLLWLRGLWLAREGLLEDWTDV